MSYGCGNTSRVGMLRFRTVYRRSGLSWFQVRAGGQITRPSQDSFDGFSGINARGDAVVSEDVGSHLGEDVVRREQAEYARYVKIS